MEFADQIDCVNFPYFESAPENKNIWFASTSEGFCISAEPGTPEYDAACKLMAFMLSKETFEGYAEVAGGGVYPVDIDYDASKSPNPMKTFMEGYATKRYNRHYGGLLGRRQCNQHYEYGASDHVCGASDGRYRKDS